MSVRPLGVLVVATFLASGALALPQPASAEQFPVERDAIVVESNNRSAIVFVPRNPGGENGRASTRAEGRDDAASSAKGDRGEKLEALPVKADIAPAK